MDRRHLGSHTGITDPVSSYGCTALNPAQTVEGNNLPLLHPHPRKTALGDKITGMASEQKASSNLHRKCPCQLPGSFSSWGQIWLSVGRPKEQISVHFLKGWTRMGAHGNLGTALSNTQDLSLVCTHTLLRSKGCRHYNENLFLCQVSTGSIPRASGGAPFLVLGLPQCSWLPVKQPPLR